MGAVFKRRGGDSLGMGLGFKSAGKELEFRFEKATNFGTIGPRSRHNRRLGRSSVVVRSSGGDSAAEAPRSRSDRTAIVEFFH